MAYGNPRLGQETLKLSGEDVSPDPVIDAYKAGVDTSLVRKSLSLSVQQSCLSVVVNRGEELTALQSPLLLTYLKLSEDWASDQFQRKNNPWRTRAD